MDRLACGKVLSTAIARVWRLRVGWLLPLELVSGPLPRKAARHVVSRWGAARTPPITITLTRLCNIQEGYCSRWWRDGPAARDDEAPWARWSSM